MKRSIAAGLLAALVAVSSPASAALNAYLQLSGKTQGEIKGSVTQKGRENKIMIVAVDHEVKNDKGKQHGLFTITKELDRSSPQLYRALASAEPMSKFELQFWTPQISAATGTGAERQHYTVTLTNARIVGIKFKMLNNKNPELMKYAEYEEISFTYDAIAWTWTETGVSATDTR